MPRDHFIPAAVLGEFSADTSGPLRSRRIAVQRTEGAAFVTRAENVGYVTNLYGAAGSFDRWVDETWTDIERELPAAIHQLELGGHLSAAVWLRTLVPHVTTLFVRGHEFEERYMERFRDSWGRESLRTAARHDAVDEKRGALDIVAQSANAARIFELQRLLALVTCARWVVCHIEPPQQFLNNDLGLAATVDRSTNQSGWLVPLSSTVAVAIFPTERREVLTWSPEVGWLAIVEHVDFDPSALDDLPRTIAASARQFIVGRDLASVTAVASEVGKLRDHRPLLENWAFTGEEKRVNEFHWHRLAAYVQNQPAPTEGVSTPLPYLPDMKALAAGWCPRMILPVNVDPRGAGLYERDGIIHMYLRDAIPSR